MRGLSYTVSFTKVIIHQVEDASTLWVREGPSNEPSEQRTAFLQLEKQFNAHFRKVYPAHHLLALPPQTGDVSNVRS